MKSNAVTPVVTKGLHRKMVCNVLNTLFQLSDDQSLCVNSEELLKVLFLTTPPNYLEDRRNMVINAFDRADEFQQLRMELRRTHKVILTDVTGLWYLTKEQATIIVNAEDYKAVVLG